MRSLNVVDARDNPPLPETLMSIPAPVETETMPGLRLLIACLKSFVFTDSGYCEISGASTLTGLLYPTKTARIFSALARAGSAASSFLGGLFP
jgi:hypothetical protein